MRWTRRIALLAALLPATAAAETLTAALAEVDYPPFYFTTEDGIVGASAELAQAVAARAGYGLEFKRFPWARVLLTLERGDADLSIHMFNTVERSEVAIFTSAPHMFEDSAFFTLADAAGAPRFRGELSALARHPIGLVRGNSHGAEFDAADFLQKVPMPSEVQLVRGLRDDHYEIAIGSPPAVLHHARDMGIAVEDLDFHAPLVDRGPVFFAVSRARPDAAEVAARLTIALVDLCRTPACAEILAPYGLEPPPVFATLGE